MTAEYLKFRGALYRKAERVPVELLKTDVSAWNAWYDQQETEVNLYDVPLYRANMTGAHLTGANLQKAHMRDSILVDAVLIFANLDGADLRNADLRGADLRYTDLGTTGLRGAKYDDTTTFPSRFDPDSVGMWKDVQP